MTLNSTAPLATAPSPPPISSVPPLLFVEPGQSAFDGIGLPAFSQPAFDGLGEPSLGGSGQPASSGLGQAALDAYGHRDDPVLWTNALPGDEAGLDFGAFMTDMDAPVMDMNVPTMNVAEPARDIAAPTMNLAAPAKDRQWTSCVIRTWTSPCQLSWLSLRTNRHVPRLAQSHPRLAQCLLCLVSRRPLANLMVLAHLVIWILDPLEA
ncbi:uncharacterized protein SCHCODRAFT_02497256 [Schizophyllum commune H4-8]|nr:uncharacterized protein SCHCODRAFT_02497256 [Schizophyllum commune H4-8]KAI5895587.1 hypothetical protein SCHCODRAFT_02497256 [Schizophyllum commune H4-8]